MSLYRVQRRRTLQSPKHLWSGGAIAPRQGWVRTLCSLAVAALLLCGGAGKALAAEARLDAPGSDGDLRDRLRAASATLSASARGETGVQPLLAAALSDYRTLVQVLYDQGYFSPVV
eukprot:CAMPEP_0195259796 /NCGR_PEP_ID=MMETSP0706-20130129/8183_1 /TAXON_ID=33640 /ORGANISM="Asterionellopsis glacialis, Strain CCMP134" /LENGTH=116 /DNA_ID=CAMNT_0040313375 /DNA_START=62 /DNA_END=409 /DNA_ORIENTATION=+